MMDLGVQRRVHLFDPSFIVCISYAICGIDNKMQDLKA
jgi:hypothetical protein